MIIQNFNLVSEGISSNTYLELESEYVYSKLDSTQSPQDFVSIMCDLFHLNTQSNKSFWLIGLDAKKQPLIFSRIPHNWNNDSVHATRAIMRRALLANAFNIILVRNDLSANLAVSDDEIKICKRINRAAKLLDVVLSDYIIINSVDNYISFATENIL